MAPLCLNHKYKYIMEEEWRDIKNYEGLYQVSNLGRVKSLDRTIVGKNGRVFPFKGKVLKPCKMSCDYEQVILANNGIHKNMLVHRLVAQAFLPNPDNLPQVSHKDETPYHNNVENLEWASAKDNINYGHRTELASKKVYQYTLDGVLIKEWKSTSECGRNGFRQWSVAACCRGEYKKHKGYIWRYEPMQPLSDISNDAS